MLPAMAHFRPDSSISSAPTISPSFRIGRIRISPVRASPLARRYLGLVQRVRAALRDFDALAVLQVRIVRGVRVAGRHQRPGHIRGLGMTPRLLGFILPCQTFTLGQFLGGRRGIGSIVRPSIFTGQVEQRTRADTAGRPDGFPDVASIPRLVVISSFRPHIPEFKTLLAQRRFDGHSSPPPYFAVMRGDMVQRFCNALGFCKMRLEIEIRLWGGPGAITWIAFCLRVHYASGNFAAHSIASSARTIGLQPTRTVRGRSSGVSL